MIIDECLKGWKELEYEVMRELLQNFGVAVVVVVVVVVVDVVVVDAVAVVAVDVFANWWSC